MPHWSIRYADSTEEVVEADRVDVEGEQWVVLRRAVTVVGRPREVVVRRVAAALVTAVEEVAAAP